MSYTSRSDQEVRMNILARPFGYAAIVLLVSFPLPFSPWSSSKASPEPTVEVPEAAALAARVRADLATFTGWLEANDANGLIGEVGWPDSATWNAVADAWYGDADRAGLWVTAWGTGEWWGTGYRLTPYQSRHGTAVDSPRGQAAVIEAHLSAGGHLRGVNVNGGEFGVEATFSNADPGRYDQHYHYDSQATFDYLAGRGVGLVRIPFRWERLQPTLNGELDQEELGHLRSVVERASIAGLVVILDMHNYGRYRTPAGELTLGSAALRSAFVNGWQRISEAFKTGPEVAYGLMNEPHDLPGGARSWELASQAAVAAIRSRGDTRLIVIGGYGWSAARSWSSTHPRAWIVDPARKIRYDAHQYFDGDSSGTYRWSPTKEDRVAAEQGYGPGGGIVRLA
jgi:hypothetical protein